VLVLMTVLPAAFVEPLRSKSKTTLFLPGVCVPLDPRLFMKVHIPLL